MLQLTLSAKTRLTETIAGFEFAAADGSALPGWAPGAHIEMQTSAGARAYSLIDWPDSIPGRYRIAVLREANGTGGSAAMHALSEGDRIEATLPKNDFELVESDRPACLLAGGIGITPMISMATALAAQGREFALHYAGRSAPLMAYRDALADAFGSAAHLYEDDGTALDLAKLMPRVIEHELYICGPRGMIDAARAAAEAEGLPPERIHVELFANTVKSGGDLPFEVEIASTGQVFTVPADQSIIEALEAEGIDLMYDCQRGDCGICQTDVIDGTPDHRDVVLSQAEKDSGKVMQICVSRARSARLVLDL